MIADLKPYAEYKESGLPWLGRMPRHWALKRGKSIFERIDRRSADGREELLTVSSARGVVPRKTATVTMFKAESLNRGYKLCWPGDLVINSMGVGRWPRRVPVPRDHQFGLRRLPNSKRHSRESGVHSRTGPFCAVQLGASSSLQGIRFAVQLTDGFPMLGSTCPHPRSRRRLCGFWTGRTGGWSGRSGRSGR